MIFYQASAKQALAELASSEHGLTSQEVKRRRQAYGPNSVTIKTTPLWKLLIEPFIDVFVLVLVIAAVISLINGETIDAIIIIAIIATSAIIYYIQRFSTDRVLKNLRNQEVEYVSVMRDGRTQRIKKSNLVPGDIIELAEGEKVPADARVITASNLRIDESLLTGESIPVAKQSRSIGGKRQVYEQSNMLFQGSFVIAGAVVALVTTTGSQTQFGKLTALSGRDSVQSPVQKKIDTLITRIIITISAIAIVAFGLALFRGMDVMESLRFVMALAVSAVPESLPIAISVILVLGMRRMAAKKALVRQMRSIETIGVINTIATDKTGTLTRNKLTVQATWAPNSTHTLDARQVGYSANGGGAKSHDPLDGALADYAKKHSAMPALQAVFELPFDQKTAMSGATWHEGGHYQTHIKGAPERILTAARIKGKARVEAEAALQTLTEHGYRVVAIASVKTDKRPSSFTDLPSLTFQGFVAVADVLRPEAKKAIETATAAGVSVRMITGDHFETAYQIARKLNMVDSRDQVFDCREMDDMSDEELDAIIQKTYVFSRVVPEQKYRILTLLKRHNITAMTGDGVNDVPALTNAHVGIAMGSGSQIAKDAGDIILLDDNFKSIVDAMREGRTIIANIRRMLFYLLSTNTGEVITLLGALLIGIQTPLEPVQILWVNLVTDTTMVIPLGLEPQEKGSMRQKPLHPNAPILGRMMIWRMIIVALTMSVITIGMYVYFEPRYGHAYAQTMAFTALVVSQWANSFSARSDYESLSSHLKVINKSFYIGLVISIVMQLLVLFGPLRHVLHIDTVDLTQMALVALISFALPITTAELHKWYCRRRQRA